MSVKVTSYSVCPENACNLLSFDFRMTSSLFWLHISPSPWHVPPPAGRGRIDEYNHDWSGAVNQLILTTDKEML